MTGSGEDQRDTTSPQQTLRGVIAGDETRRNVIVVEVGPRDGLQNESALIPTGTKIAFVDALTVAGLPLIEVTSFVNPRAVPQLADAADVMTGIRQLPGVRYPVLVPNVRGLERALAPASMPSRSSPPPPTPLPRPTSVRPSPARLNASPRSFPSPVNTHFGFVATSQLRSAVHSPVRSRRQTLFRSSNDCCCSSVTRFVWPIRSASLRPHPWTPR